MPEDEQPTKFTQAIRDARRLLDARSRQQVAHDVARIVARNPRPRELATPEAQAALVLLRRGREFEPLSDWIAAGSRQHCRVEARLLRADIPIGTLRAIGSDLAASWGELRVYVGDHNVTAHFYRGTVRPSVTWFLLPVAEWLVRQWERLLAPPRDASEIDREIPELPTAVPLPSLRVARWVHRVEIQPRGRTLITPDIRFEPREEPLLIDPGVAAHVLRGWCVALGREVQERAPSVRTEALVNQAEGLPDFRQSVEQRVLAAPLQRAVAVTKGRVGAAFDLLLAPVGERPSPLRLAFGSASPRISERDVQQLYMVADRLRIDEQPAAPRLREVRASVPLRATSPPWRQGQVLAARARQALGLTADEPPSVEGIFESLDVPIVSVQLDDSGVRGAVIGYPHRGPVVLVNRASPRNKARAGRRFTLAHELCHVLFDQGNQRALGLLDGPWAPDGIEQRANAFAAMFLMPPEFVLFTIERLGTSARVADLARAFETSPTATREHLRNLQTIGALDLREVAPSAQRNTAEPDAEGDERVPDFSAA